VVTRTREGEGQKNQPSANEDPVVAMVKKQRTVRTGSMERWRLGAEVTKMV
jgi:hypothetical protein